MNFSLALLILTAVLTPLYLLISKLSERGEHVADAGESKSKMGFAVTLGIYVLMGILVLLQFTSNVTTPFFFVLYPIISVLLLFKIRSSQESDKTHIIVTLIIFHLIILSILLPQFGVMLTERSSSLAVFSFNKVWNPTLGSIDPYYSSFPMDLGLFYVVSDITSVSHISMLTSWVVALLFIVAYDCVLYALIKRISGSWRVGVFGVLFFAFTPPALVNPQPQGLSSLLLLISLLALFEAFMRKPSISNIIIANFCFTVAILTHGTSAIGVLLLLTMLVVSYVIPRIRKVPSIGYQKRAFIWTVLITFMLITLIRWVIIGGIERVTNPLNVFLMNLMGVAQNEGIVSQSVPLYDQVVSPIHAFAWSLPVSMALAFMIYHFIYKKSLSSIKTFLPFTLGLTAAGLQLVGFLGSKLSSSVGLQRYLGQSSFVLFIPVVAIVGLKALRSSSKTAVVSIMILVMLFTGIGITDLAFSPQLYSTVNTVNPTRSEDFIEVNRLYGIISNGTSIVATYEILVAVGYLNTFEFSSGNSVRSYVGSLKRHRDVAEALMENKESISGVMYIWTPEISKAVAAVPVNVIYDSGRHVAVMEAG